MKYLLVLGDGMADYPIEEIGNKTPLEVANKPNMDYLAKNGKIGMVKTVPNGYKPGSDVANLGALGYDATKCYTGRSPLEALSIGIKMEDDDIALRTNLVTLSNDKDYENKTMIDYSSGEITTPESRELMKYINEKLGTDKYVFYGGVSYRHCLIIKHDAPEDMALTPPHDITGKKVTTYLPKGHLNADLLSLMKRSYDLLMEHPINKSRIARGLNPANSIWFWGQGTKPAIENFYERYGKTGSMVSAVDLLKGIAIGAGMKSVDVEGATGNLDTNFDGKAQAAINLFKEGRDFVFIHLEAPDECGHHGDLKGKIKAIELIDEKILGPVYNYLKDSGEDFAVLVMPDHRTPIALLTHSSEPVPFVMYSSKEKLGSNEAYNEKLAEATGLYYDKCWDLTNTFFAL